MSISEKINADLKVAMLRRDEFTTMTLRGLKSAILYEEVAKGKRDEGLNDDEIFGVITKQVKQRDDSIAVYSQAGDSERADKETREKEILAKYLPAQLTDDELGEIIAKTITSGDFTIKDMGRVIGAIKAEVGARADGGRIATMVKEALK